MTAVTTDGTRTGFERSDRTERSPFAFPEIATPFRRAGEAPTPNLRADGPVTRR